MLRIIVAIVGIGSCLLTGILAAPHVGTLNAMLFVAYLAYLFMLSLAASLALTAIMQPPFKSWHAVMPALLCFAPMFLGYFPLSGWLSNMGSSVGWQNTPSPFWATYLMMLGLIGPGGIFIEGLRKGISLMSRKRQA